MRTAVVWAGAILLLIVSVFALIAAAGQRDSLAEPGSLDTVGDRLPGVTAEDWQDGSVLAPVTIIVYTDFECPACAAYDLVLDEVMRLYPTKVRCVVRNYPLAHHRFAKIAAQAAYAAQQQARFLEMKSLLFANQNYWASSGNPALIFIDCAAKLGLDVEAFQQDMNSEAAQDFVEKQFQQAKGLGLGGTPSFFVNGKFVELKDMLPNLEGFERVIDRELTKESNASIN